MEGYLLIYFDCLYFLDDVASRQPAPSVPRVVAASPAEEGPPRCPLFCRPLPEHVLDLLRPPITLRGYKSFASLAA